MMRDRLSGQPDDARGKAGDRGAAAGIARPALAVSLGVTETVCELRYVSMSLRYLAVIGSALFSKEGCPCRGIEAALDTQVCFADASTHPLQSVARICKLLLYRKVVRNRNLDLS